MRIGPYTLRAIETGRFALDGGAMFGVVPRALWEKSAPPDARNRITMAARLLLLEGNGRRILVDTGNGAKWEQKQEEIYRFDFTHSELIRSLRSVGLTPEGVTDVILTHLHFDHAGGATVREGRDLRPTFPRATYYVQREQWEAAVKPTLRDRASFIADDFLPLREHGVLHFTEGDGEILPGLTLRTMHGHTPSLQCPVLSDGSSTLFYCADLIPMVQHLSLPWIMAYDLRPLRTLEEKAALLSRATEERWILFFEHDPVVGAATVKRGEKGYALDEVIAF
jgi:glyoxylase-like metal-dependent hydrolase (beta-lactamase superfamily II)